LSQGKQNQDTKSINKELKEDFFSYIFIISKKNTFLTLFQKKTKKRDYPVKGSLRGENYEHSFNCTGAVTTVFVFKLY